MRNAADQLSTLSLMYKSQSKIVLHKSTSLRVGSIRSGGIAGINCPLTNGSALMYKSVCSKTLFCTRAPNVGATACEYLTLQKEVSREHVR